MTVDDLIDTKPVDPAVERVHMLAVEINAAWHCNLSCVACTHASPVARRAYADPEGVSRDLSNLRVAADVDEVRILGGEPLLNPNLHTLVRVVRDAMPTSSIRLSTNGTHLHRTSYDWLEFVDEVHISRYPGTKVRSEGIAELVARCHAMSKTVILKEFHSFRDAQPRAPLTDEDTQAVFDTCQQAHAWSCRTVSDGRLYRCPVIAESGIAGDGGCALEPTDTLPRRLVAYLSRSEPLPACMNCLGTVGTRFAHRQATASTWVHLSRSGSVDRAQLDAVRRDPFANNGCSTHEVLVDGSVKSFWVGRRA
jgi:organic radical activating enzyme